MFNTQRRQRQRRRLRRQRWRRHCAFTFPVFRLVPSVPPFVVVVVVIALKFICCRGQIFDYRNSDCGCDCGSDCSECEKFDGKLWCNNCSASRKSFLCAPKSFSGNLLAQSKRFARDSWKLLALGLWQQQRQQQQQLLATGNFMLKSMGLQSDHRALSETTGQQGSVRRKAKLATVECSSWRE